MVVSNVPLMNPGNGETSYASNSAYQKKVILWTRSVLEDTLKKLYNDHGFSECLKIADLGCSSGPNTFLVISEIIDVVVGLSQQNDRKAPEFQIFLNDLPENDFNSIFKSLPAFYKKLKEERGDKKLGGLINCFIAGVPGSFYGRLFPSNSLDFVHSSYSVHWLSQVPERLENKGNICNARTSPPQVFEAYLKQFQTDFSTFLSLRSEELRPCGQMLLTLIGRRLADPTSKDCFNLWELLNESLLDMVSEGLLQGEDVDSFNFPFYLPYKSEVEAIIHEEGSFNLERLQVSEFNWDPNNNEDDDFVFDKNTSAKMIAKYMRAISESMVACHFGEFIVDDLFKKFAMHIADYPCLEKGKNINIMVSLSKKS